MADIETIRAVLDYEKTSATFLREKRDMPIGTLELAIIWRSAADEIQRLTGKEPEQFLAGMRELFERDHEQELEAINREYSDLEDACGQGKR